MRAFLNKETKRNFRCIFRNKTIGHKYNIVVNIVVNYNTYFVARQIRLFGFYLGTF